VKVNDQLCYSVLLHEEFEETILKHAELSSNLFTSSIFPSNPFSERLYRRGKDLPLFAKKSRITGLRMAVIVGYEHVAAYLDDVQRFRARMKGIASRYYPRRAGGAASLQQARTLARQAAG
jgi:hypothetical protein